MPIQFNEQTQTFHLSNNQVSYVIGIEKDSFITHRYWGKALPCYVGSNQLQKIGRAFAATPMEEDRAFSLNALSLETSTQGNGDYRVVNYQIRSTSGHDITDFRYHSYQIYEGKEGIPGLPATKANQAKVTTLELILLDTQQHLEMRLVYSLFENQPIITRRTIFYNHGTQPVFLENAGSVLVDFPTDSLDLITLYGSHINEANLSRQKSNPAFNASKVHEAQVAHNINPFFALADTYTSEFSGEVFAFHLIYSGNFVGQVELEQYGSIRAQLGIHPEHFEWVLEPEAAFYTPEAVLNYSNQGFNGMSQNFHYLYQNHLVIDTFAHKERPILLNTWEANYFDLSEESLIKQAKSAASAGIELFVLDDGWFGQRDDDTSSLGDWFVSAKFPDGLHPLAEEVHQLGMQFGLWFEPEMISKKSQLFEQHPEWALQVPNYPMTESRQQLVLDLSREDVQNYLIEQLSIHLRTGDIDYIKWDMNRHLTEVGSYNFVASQQKEINHRYVLGLYHILETLTTEFPQVLFENCSSGGGRFDPGMMYYMPQTWTSDNSDALCRSIIQYGYSYLYPPIMMGAHVSVTPNHQMGRNTPLDTRGWLAMSGNFGYELNLQELSTEEFSEVKKQIQFYKVHRSLFQFGCFYRLQAPDAYFASAWLFVNEEEAIAIYFDGLARPSYPTTYLKMHYLDSDTTYEDIETQQRYSGAELNQAGILIPHAREDFHTHVVHWKKVNE